MKKWMLAFPVLLMLLSAGCGQKALENPQNDLKYTFETDENMFTQRDRKTQYNPEECIRIQLTGSTATASSDRVRIDGSTVTLTGEGPYLLTGTLDKGCIIVDVGENAKPQLVLEGVRVNSDSAALEIREAEKVFVTLAEGTENVLSGNCSDASVDGAVFSKQDLTFNGTGSLKVMSPVAHGIVCKDDLVFTGGSYQIQSASHALDANDSVRITGDTALTLDSGKDGIHCENDEDATKGFFFVEAGTIQITAQGDGISVGAYARILDGSFDISAGGGSVNGSKAHSDFFGGFMGSGRPARPGEPQETVSEDSTSMKGLKAAGEVFIGGGNFVMDAADDAIHSNTAITVSDGTFDLSSGDDALHADETLTVTGGLLNIKTSYEGLEAHKVYVQGGEVEIHATDDGINAAGGQDESGTAGGRDGMFGGRPMGGGRPGGPMGGGASDGVIDISGGQLKIYSSGDGMDANGSIAISDGNIYVTNPSRGDTSVLDCDTGAVITGGIFLGSGATTMMAQSFDAESTQGVIACTVGDQSAGTAVSLEDASGKTLATFETEYDCVLLIISTPELKKGETYTLTVGEYSGPIQAA